MAQAGSYNEKNRGRKSPWNVPLNSGEIESAQYDTKGRLTLHSMILQGDTEKFE